MSTPQKSKIFYGWLIVASSFITLILSYGARFSFAVFYIPILNQFHWSRQSTALIYSINILTYSFSAPLVGLLVDRFGPKRIVVSGASLLGIGMVLASQSNALWHFYVFFGVIVALGNSLSGMTSHIVLVTRWFKQQRGTAVGITNSGVCAGVLLSGLAQSLINAFDWQMAFTVMGIIMTLMIIFLVTFFQRRNPENGNVSLNGTTSLQAPNQKKDPPMKVNSERTTPMVLGDWTWKKAMRSYRFWFLALVFFSSYGVFGTLIFVHQVAFAVGVGYDPILVASIFTFFGLLMVLGNYLGGLISDRWGREKTHSAGCLGCILGFAALIFLKDPHHLWLLYLWAVFMGLGYGVMATINNTAVADLFEGKNLGAIFGFCTTAFGIGGFLGSWMGGYIFDLTGSYKGAFAIGMAWVCIAGIAMWIAAPRKTLARLS